MKNKFHKFSQFISKSSENLIAMQDRDRKLKDDKVPCDFSAFLYFSIQ